MKIVFNIEPQQQERPRATGRGRFIRVYDPPKTAKFKRELKQLATEMYHDAPLEGEIYLKVAFYRKIQKSISKKEHDRRASGEHRPIVKPDLSNYLKAFEDALNGVLWKDDATIVELNTSKWYSDYPRIEIEVKELKNNEERNQN